MENIRKTSVLVQARAGADISYCISEAIILSIEEKVNVELLHNNKTFVINYEHLLDTVNKYNN